ncbi:MAG: flagellar motor protein MotB, partial [Alphaproteobacteria bacterium]
MTGPEDEDGRAGTPPWLMTFADVTALMLTFFVMMFAMSNVESERWDAIISLLSTSERPSVKEEPVPTATRNIATVKLESALPLDYLDRILTEKLSRDAVLADARVHRLDGRVVLSLPGGTLFAEGHADIMSEAREALFRLSGVISTIGNRVVVEGHTDPDPQSDKAD